MRGIGLALIANFIWGLAALYWMQTKPVEAIDVMASSSDPQDVSNSRIHLQHHVDAEASFRANLQKFAAHCSHNSTALSRFVHRTSAIAFAENRLRVVARAAVVVPRRLDADGPDPLERGGVHESVPAFSYQRASRTPPAICDRKVRTALARHRPPKGRALRP